MSRFAALLATLLAMGASVGAAGQDAPAALALEPGHIARATIRHDGRERTFLYRIPNGFDPAAAHPLIFLLHGNGAPIEEPVDNFADMQPPADADGTILVYPVLDYASRAANDANVGFIERLLDLFSSEIAVDADRVYAAGTSAGGSMAQILACEVPHRFAGIAPTAYLPYVGMLGRCRPDPLPVMIVSGTADPLVPFEGAAIAIDGWPDRLLSAEEYVAYWMGRNGVAAPAAETAIEDRVTEVVRGVETPSHVVRYDWSGPSGNDLAWLKVVGGGHFTPRWADGEAVDSATHAPVDLSHLGTINSDYSAAGAIYEFFLSHDRKDRGADADS